MTWVNTNRLTERSNSRTCNWNTFSWATDWRDFQNFLSLIYESNLLNPFYITLGHTCWYEDTQKTCSESLSLWLVSIPILWRLWYQHKTLGVVWSFTFSVVFFSKSNLLILHFLLRAFLLIFIPVSLYLGERIPCMHILYDGKKLLCT